MPRQALIAAGLVVALVLSHGVGYVQGYASGAKDSIAATESRLTDMVEARVASLRNSLRLQREDEVVSAYASTVQWYEERVRDLSDAYKECVRATE